jgi:hypothetical protein
MSKAWGCLTALVLACALAGAQSYPPGYIDPLPLLDAASKEIGERNLRYLLRHRLRRRRGPNR